MTIENAVKALAKHGDVTYDNNGHWSATIGRDIVGFYTSVIGPGNVRGSACAIYVAPARCPNSATWFPSLKSAIDCALRTTVKAASQ